MTINKNLLLISWLMTHTLCIAGQKVGIGTIAPVATLNLIGPGLHPAIPGATSAGIFRIGVSAIEGMDMGKMVDSTFAGWIQVGYNGFVPDPLSLQPKGGNVGIGLVNPSNKLSVAGNANVTGKLGIGYTVAPLEKLDVNGKIKIGNDATTSVAGTIRWNVETNDFEGFNGTQWLSMTQSNNANQWPEGDLGQITDFQQTTSSDGAFEDSFGSAVSMSGDYAIIGASGDIIGANLYQGSAYIFVKSGDTWIEQAKLIASDGVAHDRFGNYVSISGDHAIVGVPGHAIGANTSQGAAYIFMRSGEIWSQIAKIVASDGAASDGFGRDVEIEGDYIIVGANGNNVGGAPGRGSAYVFVNAGGTWVQQANLVASDGASSDNLGTSVSISGEYAIAGAPGDNVTYADQGSAYIYLRSGTTWTQQAKILAIGGDVDDNFGWSVSMEGEYVSVGAPFEDASNRGAAFIFHRSGTAWTQQAKFVAPFGTTNEYFGYSLDFSGETLLVGAYNDESFVNCSQPVRIGIGYIFKKQNNIWTLYSTVEDPLGENNEQFCYSVSLTGNSFIAGANRFSVNGFYSQGKVIFGNID